MAFSHGMNLLTAKARRTPRVSWLSLCPTAGGVVVFVCRALNDKRKTNTFATFAPLRFNKSHKSPASQFHKNMITHDYWGSTTHSSKREQNKPLFQALQ